jgi:peptidylprolyl isomerase
VPRTGVLAILLTAALTLTSCGEEATSASGAGPEAISVSGDFKSAPKVTVDNRVEVTQTSTEVLIEGEGDEVQEGERILAHLTIANGYSKDVVFSSYDNEGKPQVVDAKESALAVGLQKAIIGQKLGSRVMSVSPPEDSFGEQGNSSIGIGNKDSVIFIVDLLSKVATEPSGQDVKPATWAPQLILSDEVPTGLNFAQAPKPGPLLLKTFFIEGDGAPVKKGDNVTVNYLGQVYQGKAPFDASFSRGEPFEVANVGEAQVIKAWNQGLIGVPVGSRIMLRVPPSLGYGKTGQPEAGIKGTDTMYFLIDVLYVS